MTPGRELDALVAEKVMRLELRTGDPSYPSFWKGGCIGKSSTRVPDYSTDIAAAWEVVEELGAEGAALHLKAYRHENPPKGQEHRACFWSRDYSKYAFASTTPLAICLAALAAVGAEVPA